MIPILRDSNLKGLDISVTEMQSHRPLEIIYNHESCLFSSMVDQDYQKLKQLFHHFWLYTLIKYKLLLISTVLFLKHTKQYL